jgi:hypothetical protein
VGSAHAKATKSTRHDVYLGSSDRAERAAVAAKMALWTPLTQKWINLSSSLMKIRRAVLTGVEGDYEVITAIRGELRALREAGSYTLAQEELSLVEQYTYECEAELLLADACCACMALTQKTRELCKETSADQRRHITDVERRHVLPISPALSLLRAGLNAGAMARLSALQPATRPEVISLSAHPQYYLLMERLAAHVYALLVAASTADRSRLVGLRVTFAHLAMNPALQACFLHAAPAVPVARAAASASSLQGAAATMTVMRALQHMSGALLPLCSYGHEEGGEDDDDDDLSGAGTAGILARSHAGRASTYINSLPLPTGPTTSVSPFSGAGAGAGAGEGSAVASLFHQGESSSQRLEQRQEQ